MDAKFGRILFASAWIVVGFCFALTLNAQDSVKQEDNAQDSVRQEEAEKEEAEKTVMEVVPSLVDEKLEIKDGT